MKTYPNFIHYSKTNVTPFKKDITACTTAGDPQQHVWLYCNSISAGARFGVWDCLAGSHLAKMSNIIEFCYIIEGSAAIKNLDTGEVHHVIAGDAFIMEPNLNTEWFVEHYVKKYFVITDAPEQDPRNDQASTE